MHSPKICPGGYTNTFLFEVVEIPLSTSEIMNKVFDISPEQFYGHLLQTIAAQKCYRLSFQNSDHQHFTFHCPSKGIFIDCHVVSGNGTNGTTELNLSATSPICVISPRHEQQILADLLVQLDDSIHHPAHPTTTIARHFSFRLKGFRFLKKVFSPDHGLIRYNISDANAGTAADPV
jgi:hypothetical protein